MANAREDDDDGHQSALYKQEIALLKRKLTQFQDRESRIKVCYCFNTHFPVIIDVKLSVWSRNGNLEDVVTKAVTKTFTNR